MSEASLAFRAKRDAMEEQYKTMDQEARALLLRLETEPPDLSLTRRVLLEVASWQRQQLWQQIQAVESASTALTGQVALDERLRQLERFGVSEIALEMIGELVVECTAQAIQRLAPVLAEQNETFRVVAGALKALHAHVTAIYGALSPEGQIEAEAAPGVSDIVAAVDRLAGTIQDAVANLPKPEPRGGEIELIRDDRGNIIGARPKRKVS